MAIVQFIGLTDLDAEQRADAQRHVQEFADKLERSYSIEHLTVHLKVYDKGGKPKFSVHLKLVSPRHTKDAAYDDYVLSKAIHGAFAALQKQLEHEGRGFARRIKALLLFRKRRRR